MSRFKPAVILVFLAVANGNLPGNYAREGFGDRDATPSEARVKYFHRKGDQGGKSAFQVLYGGETENEIPQPRMSSSWHNSYYSPRTALTRSRDDPEDLGKNYAVVGDGEEKGEDSREEDGDDASEEDEVDESSEEDGADESSEEDGADESSEEDGADESSEEDEDEEDASIVSGLRRYKRPQTRQGNFRRRQRQRTGYRYGNRGRGGWGRGGGRRRTVPRNSTPRPRTTATPRQHSEEEKGNYLEYLGFPRMANGCPDGKIQDAYGYCRDQFYTQNRDWDWWINIRNFVLGGHGTASH